MVKHLYIYILLFFCAISFAQEASIPTRFSQEGKLFKSLDEVVNQLKNPIASFKEGQKCTVIAYLGNDNYKIQFKDWTGLVTIEDLEVNDAIDDLYFEFQEKEHQRRLKEEEARKRRLYQIVNKDKIGQQRRLDSIAKVEAAERKRIALEQEEARKQAEALKQQRRLDSIAKVEAAERKRIALEQEAARKRAEALKQQRRLDSIAKVEAAEHKRIELEQEAERKRLEALKTKRRLDSIAKVEAAERKRIALEQEAARKRLEALKTKRRLDSIAKVEAAERKRIALEQEAERKRLEALKQQRRLDSIAKVEAAERKRIALEQEEARKRAEALKQQRRLDSIAKVEAAERKRIALEQEAERKRLEALKQQRRLDSIAKEEAAERKRIVLEKEAARKRAEALKTKRRLDSVARVKEFERKKQALIRERAIKKAEALREKKRLEAMAKAEAEEKNNSKKINIKELELQKYRSACHYVMNEFDNLYQEKVIMTKAYKIHDDLKAELYKKGKRIDLFLTSNINIGCVSGFSNKNTYVKILLENGNSVVLYHTYGTSCSGFEFKGKLAHNYVETLQKSPIKSIVLKGTKGAKEITNINYKAFFIDKLKCVE